MKYCDTTPKYVFAYGWFRREVNSFLEIRVSEFQKTNVKSFLTDSPGSKIKKDRKVLDGVWYNVKMIMGSAQRKDQNFPSQWPGKSQTPKRRSYHLN